jgi:hypothetical protein
VVGFKCDRSWYDLSVIDRGKVYAIDCGMIHVIDRGTIMCDQSWYDHV